jgi:pimeloyl-ACP methyl ester carboxylesterase
LLAACSTCTNTIPRGGHFAAFEQPGLFVTELRNWFRALR